MRKNGKKRCGQNEKVVFGIDPFELFCAYHLGLTPDGSYRFMNVHDVAKLFRVSPGVIKEALNAYEMHPDILVNSDFDVSEAQVDIQLAPPEIDKLEEARRLYGEFRSARRGARRWEQELEEDARANQDIYGGRGAFSKDDN
ncbi:MAG: hypothetical protein FJ125_08800 [Deltaproteobacteria bacterium]|nr:hypothetical protein [Deltaproteobacteria bacterium]